MTADVSYAGDEEDLWLLAQFPQGYRGHAVELGALDGTYLSCTRLLEEKGWTVLCIEPNPRHQEPLRNDRKNVLTCACDRSPAVKARMWENHDVTARTQTSLEEKHDAWEVSFEATVLTLDQCLMVAGFPRLDVLVLDVDGLEGRIIEGFDIERWNPKAVIVEARDAATIVPFLERGYKQVGMKKDSNRLLIKEEA